MTTIINDDLYSLLLEGAEIEHYGKLGMKWGVRKDAATTKVSGKSSKQMTDAELKAAVTRMTLERNYAKMMSENAKANRTFSQKVVDSVSEAVVAAGKSVIQSYAQKAMTNAINSALAPRPAPRPAP